MIGFPQQFWEAAQRLFLWHEGRCVLCHDVHQQSVPFCETCLAALVRPAAGQCPRCGRLYEAASAHTCGECLQKPPPWEHFAMIGPYRGALRQLLLQGKFRTDNAALGALGHLLIEPARCLPLSDALVPMPLHPARLRQRGFNQCLELARPVARALSLPLLPHLLARSVNTAHQQGLSAEARRRNLRGAFVPGSVRSMRVLLLDDVSTTGTTLRQAAQALVDAGAVVDVLVAGRA